MVRPRFAKGKGYLDYAFIGVYGFDAAFGV